MHCKHDAHSKTQVTSTGMTIGCCCCCCSHLIFLECFYNWWRVDKPESPDNQLLWTCPHKANAAAIGLGLVRLSSPNTMAENKMTDVTWTYFTKNKHPQNHCSLLLSRAPWISWRVENQLLAAPLWSAGWLHWHCFRKDCITFRLWQSIG